MSESVNGRCECGKVRFTVNSPRESVTVCHCSQCRRVSGHLWAATRAPFSEVTFIEQAGLEWYTSSDFAKRGFCRHCGSSLFYRMNDENGIGIAVGCLENTSSLKVAKHIFVKDKGDYYDIADGCPQIDRF